MLAAICRASSRVRSLAAVASSKTDRCRVLGPVLHGRRNDIGVPNAAPLSSQWTGSKRLVLRGKNCAVEI
jgi:hypothetical protein